VLQLPILPLEALVFTPKGNIHVVGHYFKSKSLLLDHPSPHRYHAHYSNPHNPPPGGWSQALLNTPYQNRWVPQISGKSMEVQRSQVEELFKSLQSGDDLPECDPRVFCFICFTPLAHIPITLTSIGYCFKAVPAPEESTHFSSRARARIRRKRRPFIALARTPGSNDGKEDLVPRSHATRSLRRTC
jgi:hypothetical protein